MWEGNVRRAVLQTEPVIEKERLGRKFLQHIDNSFAFVCRGFHTQLKMSGQVDHSVQIINTVLPGASVHRMGQWASNALFGHLEGAGIEPDGLQNNGKQKADFVRLGCAWIRRRRWAGGGTLLTLSR